MIGSIPNKNKIFISPFAVLFMAKEGIIGTLLNPFAIIISLIALFVIALIILIFIEIRLRAKIKKLRKENDSNLVVELKNLLDSKQPLKERLDLLDKTAKSFLSESYSISPNLDYSDLVDDFRRRNKPEISQFCDLMVSVYYSGKPVNEERINTLAKVLMGIIRKTSSRRFIAQIPEVFGNQNQSLIDKKSPENRPGKEPIHMPPHLTKKFERYLEIASDNRREVEKISEELKSNKEIIELSNESVKKEGIRKMIHDNPDEFSKLKKAEIFITRNHLALNTLIKKVHADLPHIHKKKISHLAKEWRRESKKVFSKAKNPFKQYLQEMELLKDFFIKLGLIIAKEGIISKNQNEK